MGDLNIDRRSWLYIDYLRASPFEEYCLGVVELAVVNPYFMVLVADNSKTEPPVYWISTRSLRAYVIAIQEYLISSHSLGYYCGCRIACGCSGRLRGCIYRSRNLYDRVCSGWSWIDS